MKASVLRKAFMNSLVKSLQKTEKIGVEKVLEFQLFYKMACLRRDLKN